MITTIKQYGEIRTGTNYLRALIQRNYPDIHVLSYILGDKHSPPVPFDAIWEEAQQTGTDAAFNFVSTATFTRRGGASHPKDLTQREELSRRAPHIARAYSTGALGFLITIKDPYAWIVSAAKFKQWIRGDAQLQDWALEMMQEACLAYNRNYKEWISFVQANQPRARLIRYEDLLADPGLEMAKIASQFDWCLAGSFENYSAVIEPTCWDHLPVVEAEDSFRPAYYHNREYLKHLQTAHIQVINSLMEWDLLREYGYAKL